MSDNEKQLIRGNHDDNRVNPDGHGHIDIGKGKDVVVLGEGDFFSINGFQDSDVKNLSKSKVEKVNSALSFFGSDTKLEAEQDKLVMFIEPEKESVQSVQYFERGGITYVQLYDNELNEVVAASRVVGTGFKIEIVGDNESLGITPEKLLEEATNDKFANDINELIAKGEVSRDNSLVDKFENYVEKQMDEAKTSWNPLDKLASKIYETQKDLGK